MNYQTFPTYAEMSKAAAKIIADVLRAKPDCVLGLATGSSPIGAYDELARMHRVPNGTAADPAAECAAYDARLDSFGGSDIQLLGIGPDGHIGFNEPADVFTKGTHLVDLDPSTIEANARFFDSAADVPRQALTMGMGGIMGAKKILLVASGAGKKAVLEAAMNGPIDPRLPASILQLHKDVTVLFSVNS